MKYWKNVQRGRHTVTAARLRLLALLLSIATGAVSGAETADTLKFRTWRLAAQGADAVMVTEFAGRSPVNFPEFPLGKRISTTTSPSQCRSRPIRFE